MMTDNEAICHNDCIQKFNDKLYSDIFTMENIVSKKKVVPINDEKHYGYFLEKNNELYFIIAENIEHLPFKVEKYKEMDYKGDVFNLILNFKSINIPTVKKMSFRNLIDTIGNFKHTHQSHFTLAKILEVTAIVDRVNARISTEAGFGKDSIAGILKALVGNTNNIYGGTFAKLEYSLVKKLIILNEMGNLKKEEKEIMQEFLLAVGAYHNTYTKRTRKTHTTQEEYDISKLSLIIFYNLPSYYTGKAQEYFDQIFTPAVAHRFIPFVFDGRLTTEFESVINVNNVVEKYDNIYKDVIATLNWYKDNNVKDIKFEIPNKIRFSTKEKRYERSFNIILKYIGEYCETQEEFNMMSNTLYDCYKKYDTLISKQKSIQ